MFTPGFQEVADVVKRVCLQLSVPCGDVTFLVESRSLPSGAQPALAQIARCGFFLLGRRKGAGYLLLPSVGRVLNTYKLFSEGTPAQHGQRRLQTSIQVALQRLAGRPAHFTEERQLHAASYRPQPRAGPGLTALPYGTAAQRLPAALAEAGPGRRRPRPSRLPWREPAAG